MEDLRRDLEYVHAKSEDYLAYDLETGEEAMAPTKEVVLVKLEKLAPNAKRV